MLVELVIKSQPAAIQDQPLAGGVLSICNCYKPSHPVRIECASFWLIKNHLRKYVCMYVCIQWNSRTKAKFEQESINLEFYKIFINKCYF